MRRLTGLDAAFLYLETPNSPMHVGGVYVLEGRRPANQLYSRLRAVIAARLHLMAPLRWRLMEVPLGLHHPLWINDPAFDLDRHLVRDSVSAGDEADPLGAFVAALMAVPLDRTRPLWELHVVDGLPGGHLAVVTKVHHALIDGHSGAELTATLMDITAEPRTVDPPASAWVPEAVPSSAELLAYGLTALAQQPAHLVAQLRAAARTQAEATPGDQPYKVPRTAFNGPITSNRRYAYGDLAMADVMAVRSASGATVNDVLLAVCGGALRKVLRTYGQLPVEPLVAMVPINNRTASEKNSMGNQVGQMFCALGTDIEDPVERLQAVTDGAARAKARALAGGGKVAGSVAQFAAPALAIPAVAAYSSWGLAGHHRPLFNLTVSNVVGTKTPLFCAGAAVAAWYPVGPVFDGVGLNITAMSYRDRLHVGVLACPDSVPWINELVRELPKALDELDASVPAK